MHAPAEASGLALRPCVKGYCRPDLPAHYREKFGFVLWWMTAVEELNVDFSSHGKGLQRNCPLERFLIGAQMLSRSLDACDANALRSGSQIRRQEGGLQHLLPPARVRYF